MKHATIGGMPGATPENSGKRAVGLLIPLKVADCDHLAAVLARDEAFARGCDHADDDAALGPLGDDNPVEWSHEEVRALMALRD